MLPELSSTSRFEKELTEWNKKIKLLRDENSVKTANKLKNEILSLVEKINELHKPILGNLQKPSLLQDDRQELTLKRVQLNQFLKQEIVKLKSR